MKKLSKVLVLVLSAIMVLAMSASVFAGTIEVQDVLDGETYTAYKILNYTNNGDAYSYYLTSDEYASIGAVLREAGFDFTASADGSQYYVNNAEALTESGVSEVAAALAESLDDLGNALGKFTAVGADGEAVFTDLPTGYYFVTSSAGSLCALHDDREIATVVEKNTMLTDDKEVDENSKNAQVGDVLSYTITLTDGKGTNLAATLTDTLSKGLSFNDDAKASINGGTATAISPTVTVNDDGSTTVVYTFDAATMTALEEGETIVVTYTATLNEDASLDGTETNTEYTEYSEQKTEGKTVDVGLSDLTINKTDGTNALKGAQFKLYRTDEAVDANHADVKLRQLTDAELEAAEITKAENTVYYTVDPDGTNLIDMAQKESDAEDAEFLYSSAVIYGLDKDSTYYIEETKAPDGYNLLDEEVEAQAGGTAPIEVVNNAGTVLPGTGGIGTTIFYILGSALVIGCGIVLISRKRMQNK